MLGARMFGALFYFWRMFTHEVALDLMNSLGLAKLAQPLGCAYSASVSSKFSGSRAASLASRF